MTITKTENRIEYYFLEAETLKGWAEITFESYPRAFRDRDEIIKLLGEQPEDSPVFKTALRIVHRTIIDKYSFPILL